MILEQPTTRVIAKGRTLARNLNRARKNYRRNVMTNRNMLFNLLEAK